MWRRKKKQFKQLSVARSFPSFDPASMLMFGFLVRNHRDRGPICAMGGQVMDSSPSIGL